MRNIIILSLSIIIIQLSLKAQDIDVKVGPEFESPKRSSLSGILGSDESGYYILQYEMRGRKTYYRISHFNNDLILSRQLVLEPEYEGKTMDVENVFYMNDKIYLFTSFVDTRQGKKFLFSQTVDKKSLIPNNDFIKIEEIEIRSKSNSGDYVIELSRDTSKVVLIKQLPVPKDSPERFALKVLHSSSELLWEKEVELPYTERLFNISRYVLSNEGDVFILGRLYDERVQEKRHGMVNYKYIILAYKKDKTFREYEVTLGDKFITDLQVAISDKGEFICTGYYSHVGTRSIAGTYFMKIDPIDNGVTSQHHKEFSKDFLTQYSTERETRKIERIEQRGDDVELFEFDLDEVLVREDGGAYMIGEQYYMRTVTTTQPTGNGGFTTRTTYYYYYNDIIVTSFGPNGSIEWMEKVPKRQVSTNDHGFYSSYVRGLYKGNLYILFNDHIQNLETWTTGKFKNYTAGEKGVVTLVTLDKTGKQNRIMLYKAKDIESITVPKVSKQISKNELILYGQRRKMHQLSRVLFK